MRKILVLLVAACAASPAFADWSGKDATGATITFKNPNVCTSVVCVPIASLVDSTGAAVGTAGAPLRIDPTGTTTQPMSAAALPLPTGAATSANQATGNTTLSTIATNTSSPIPAGTNTTGNVGSDPSSGKSTPTFVFLALPATTTTQIIALSGSTKTYVTTMRILAGGTVNVTLKYGTGANCGTGTTTLEGPYPLTAQAGLTSGSGTGAVLIVPSAQALCVTTDASTTGGVALTYQQF
jgi:hypothetical protein